MTQENFTLLLIIGIIVVLTIFFTLTKKLNKMRAFNVELSIAPIDKSIGKTKVKGVIIAQNASEMTKKAISETQKDLAFKAEIIVVSAKELPNDFLIL